MPEELEEEGDEGTALDDALLFGAKAPLLQCGYIPLADFCVQGMTLSVARDAAQAHKGRPSVDALQTGAKTLLETATFRAPLLRLWGRDLHNLHPMPDRGVDHPAVRAAGPAFCKQCHRMLQMRSWSSMQALCTRVSLCTRWRRSGRDARSPCTAAGIGADERCKAGRSAWRSAGGNCCILCAATGLGRVRFSYSSCHLHFALRVLLSRGSRAPCHEGHELQGQAKACMPPDSPRTCCCWLRNGPL